MRSSRWYWGQPETNAVGRGRPDVSTWRVSPSPPQSAAFPSPRAALDRLRRECVPATHWLRDSAGQWPDSLPNRRLRLPRHPDAINPTRPHLARDRQSTCPREWEELAGQIELRLHRPSLDYSRKRKRSSQTSAVPSSRASKQRGVLTRGNSKTYGEMNRVVSKTASI